MTIFMNFFATTVEKIEPLKLNELPSFTNFLIYIIASLIIIFIALFFLIGNVNYAIQDGKPIKKMVVWIIILGVIGATIGISFNAHSNNIGQERISITKEWALNNYDLILNNTQAAFVSNGGVSTSRLRISDYTVVRASTTEGVVKSFVVDLIADETYVLRFLEDDTEVVAE